jgi:cytochrome c551/c552
MIRALMTLSGFAVTVLQPTWTFADDRRQGFSPLAVQQHCDECHAIRETVIGPPFLAIALRYATVQDTAVERLARKIIDGGAGNWGTIPMVPNERVSLEDARGIARWILSLSDRN